MQRPNFIRSRAASVVGALALIAMGLYAGLAWAEPSETDLDAGAVILVADPDFNDPLWRGTVLLATPLPNGGHLGVIINRPTELKLGQIFPEHEASRKVLDPVYYGGPFLGNMLFAVVRSGDASGKGSVALTPDLVLAVEAEIIDRIIEQAPASARYYLGVVLWQPGELRLELENELWSVQGARTETVFRTDMEQLWKELSVAIRGTRATAPLPTPVVTGAYRSL